VRGLECLDFAFIQQKALSHRLNVFYRAYGCEIIARQDGIAILSLGERRGHASQDFADNPPPVVCDRSCRYDASEKAVAAQFAFRRDLVFVRRLGLLCMGHMTLSLRCSSLYSITLSATKSPAPSHDISMVRGHDRVAVALSESRGPAAQFAKNRCNASIASFRHDPREKWEGPIGD